MEIKNSLTEYDHNGEPAWLILDHHTHSDILRFVADDIGIDEAIFLLEQMKEKNDC